MLLAIQILLPQKGIIGRLLNYLNEMYPIVPRMFTASLLFISFTIFLGEINQQGVELLSIYSFVGIWALFALALILRLMDELKDKELDARLFKNRPLPSDRVLENDITFSLILITVLYLASHSFSILLLASSFVVLKYSYLMYKYFFVPKKYHSNLLLNLFTHNPIVLLFLLHVATIYQVQNNLEFSSLDITPLLLVAVMFWFLFLSWEIARKIRYKKEETEYITYSSIFGTFKAGFIALSIQTISFGFAVYFYLTLSLSLVYLIIILIGYLLLLKSYFLFFNKKLSHGLKLKTSAEIYATIFMSAIIIEYLSRMV